MLTKRQMRTVFSRFEIGDGCWEWQGSLDRNGYGTYGIHGGQRWAAHRLIYTIAVGRIPEGLHLDHLCRNIRCVKPAHLEAVTPQENVRRARNANAEKSACVRGHAFDEANTYTYRGRRICRACNRLAKRGVES